MQVGWAELDNWPVRMYGYNKAPEYTMLAEYGSMLEAQVLLPSADCPPPSTDCFARFPSLSQPTKLPPPSSQSLPPSTRFFLPPSTPSLPPPLLTLSSRFFPLVQGGLRQGGAVLRNEQTKFKGGTSASRSKLAAPRFWDLAGFGFALLSSKNFVVVGGQFDHRSKEVSLKMGFPK